MRTVLTIAGSDSGGGAGIQADIKTFCAFGVFGATAITAITAQNTVEVSAVEALAPTLVVAQIDAVVTDIGADAVKIGMLANREIIRAVSDAVRRHELQNVVLDTVMVSKGGARLLDAEAVEALVTDLLPLAAVATPNAVEAEVITGRPVRTVAGLHEAAAALVGLGARAVVVKGGHLEGPAIDVFHDGRTSLEIYADRLPGPHTHGTGCTFSAAIAARLALGDEMEVAVRAAKKYVTQAIAAAPRLGRGHGPLGHIPAADI